MDWCWLCEYTTRTRIVTKAISFVMFVLTTIFFSHIFHKNIARPGCKINPKYSKCTLRIDQIELSHKSQEYVITSHEFKEQEYFLIHCDQYKDSTKDHLKICIYIKAQHKFY